MSNDLRDLKRLAREFSLLLNDAGEETVVGERSLRALVLHLLGWDLLTLSSLQLALASETPVMFASDEAVARFNASAAKFWEKLSWLEVVIYYRQTSALILRTYNLMTRIRLQNLLKTDAIADDVAHYDKHLAQLRQALADSKVAGPKS